MRSPWVQAAGCGDGGVWEEEEEGVPIFSFYLRTRLMTSSSWSTDACHYINYVDLL